MKKHLTHKIAAVLSAAVVAGTSSDAFAQGTTDSVSTLQSNVIGAANASLPGLMSLIGYMGGSALSIAGIIHLKQHVDAPAQKDLKGGLMRLASGGALLSLPLITQAMQGAVNGSNGTQGSADYTLSGFGN